MEVYHKASYLLHGFVSLSLLHEFLWVDMLGKWKMVRNSQHGMEFSELYCILRGNNDTMYTKKSRAFTLLKSQSTARSP